MRAEHLEAWALPGVMLMGKWCHTWYRDALDDKQARVMMSSSFRAHRVVGGLAESRQMRGRCGLSAQNPCLCEVEAGVFPVNCLGSLCSQRWGAHFYGCRKGTLQVLAWAAFIALPVSQQGAEAAGRWEQQQEEPSREQASHQHGTQSLMGRKSDLLGTHQCCGSWPW